MGVSDGFPLCSSNQHTCLLNSPCQLFGVEVHGCFNRISEWHQQPPNPEKWEPFLFSFMPDIHAKSYSSQKFLLLPPHCHHLVFVISCCIFATGLWTSCPYFWFLLFPFIHHPLPKVSKPYFTLLFSHLNAFGSSHSLSEKNLTFIN